MSELKAQAFSQGKLSRFRGEIFDSLRSGTVDAFSMGGPVARPGHSTTHEGAFSCAPP